MSEWAWEEQARHALQDIVALGFDYDGFSSAKDLKGLIDDLVLIAKQALKGEYKYTKDFWKILEEYKEYINMKDENIIEDRGYAFKTKENKWYLVRCPKCHKENHAMAVASGTCVWCEFNMNKDEEEHKNA